MGVDEDRLWVAGEEAVLLRDQLVPREIGLLGLVAVGAEFELEPTLVVLVHRLEEAGGITGVDEHGDLILGAHSPDAVEARVVGFDALALAVLEHHAEVLPDLEADGAGFDVGFDLGGGAGGKIGIVESGVVDVGHDGEAAGGGGLHRGDGVDHPFAVAAADGRVDERAHVEAVHVGDEPLDSIRGDVAVVGVDVDERKFGAGGLMLGDAEGGLGVEFLDRNGLGDGQRGERGGEGERKIVAHKK